MCELLQNEDAGRKCPRAPHSASRGQGGPTAAVGDKAEAEGGVPGLQPPRAARVRRRPRGRPTTGQLTVMTTKLTKCFLFITSIFLNGKIHTQRH